jgi:molybdopterin synthase catalytic subunit/molybdopterin converting factor small subunit
LLPIVREGPEIEVRYYAAARELVGAELERLTLPDGPMDADALLRLLAERHPRLAPVAGRMRLAVNGELAVAGARVHPGDEISVLPPVAGGSDRRKTEPGGSDRRKTEPGGSDRRDTEPGGSDRIVLCEVRDTELSVDELLQALAHPAAGGVSLFVGVVRDHADGKPVARLDYEAHPTMAEQELRRVLTEVAAEQPDVRVGTVHRVGELQVGDLAIVVGASAPHRAEALAACRAAIERIKQRVPIWKKEWAPDGSAGWVNLEG